MKFKVGDRVAYVGKDIRAKIGSRGTVTDVKIYNPQYGIFTNKFDWDIPEDMRNNIGKVDEALVHEALFESPLYKALT